MKKKFYLVRARMLFVFYTAITALGTVAHYILSFNATTHSFGKFIPHHCECFQHLISSYIDFRTIKS